MAGYRPSISRTCPNITLWYGWAGVRLPRGRLCTCMYKSKYMIWKIYSQIHISFCFSEHAGVEVTLLIYIWEVLGLNLCRDTGHLASLLLFASVRPNNAWNISIRQQPISSKSFPIQFLPTILRFDIILYNPESFVSALSSSKQHWPIVTCWPGKMPVVLSACTIPLESRT
jgi:hypothetical protein